jgi:hypothetical protein
MLLLGRFELTEGLRFRRRPARADDGGVGHRGPLSASSVAAVASRSRPRPFEPPRGPGDALQRQRCTAGQCRYLERVAVTCSAATSATATLSKSARALAQFEWLTSSTRRQPDAE